MVILPGNPTETMENPSTTNEEALLLQAGRLQKEREAIKELIDQLDHKISLHTSKLSHIGKTRESEEELVAKLERLELKHETTTQSSADERNFIRDMNKLKEQKKKLVEYNSIQSELDEIKNQRKLKYFELKSIEKQADEIQLSLRKIKLVANIKCEVSSLVEHRLNVPQLKMSHIIGKNRQQLVQLENSCGVSIKIETRSGSSADEGCLTILGTESTINNAINKINDIINTDVDEFECRDDIIVSLILNKFSLLNSIQLKHDVKIDVSRAKKVCKISGFNQNRIAAKNEILSIDSVKTLFNIESSMFPVIFGKQGATISALSSENIVEINVDKDLNTISILGGRKNVDQTVSQINRIIEENKEIVDVIEGSKSVILGCFIGNHGSIVKQLEKDLGVYLHHEEVDDAPFRLIIRGNISKISTAKLHLERMLKNYINDIDCIIVPESCFLPLLGKANKNSLSELRKDHTDTKIDLEGKEIKIFSTNPESRQKVKDRLRQLFSENHLVKIDCSVDTGIQLKSSKCLELRKILQTELNLNVDIDSECTSVTLRGTVENLDRGVQLLQGLKEQTYQEEFPITLDDEKALQSGGVNCAAKNFELQYDVTVYINRKDSVARIRGLQSDVAKAKTAITGFLNGDIKCGSILIDINPLAYSNVIGAEGKNLKSLEKKYSVQIDVLKAVNKLRLRGATDILLGARSGILSYLSDLRYTLPIQADLTMLDATAFSDLIGTVSSLYSVELTSDIDKKKIQIRGFLHEIGSIEGCIESVLTNTDKFTLSVYDRHANYVEQYKSTEPFQKIERKYNVQFIVDKLSSNCTVTLQSLLGNVESAKKDFFKLMDSAFPSEFLSVAMSVPCISFMTSPVVIDELNSIAQSKLSIDRKCSCLRVCGNVESVKNFTSIVKEKIKSWDLLHDKVDIDEFMLPIILGKGKHCVKEIESELNAKVKVNKNSLRLEIEASSPSHLQSCMAKISQILNQIQREHVEVDIDPQLLSSFIGSNGSNIKKLQEQTGVSIYIDKKKTGRIILEGNEEKVLDAKQKVLEFSQREIDNKNTIEITVPLGAISIIIGHKGATINKISESTGAKVNVDKNTNNILIRGPTNACNLCVESINNLLNAEGLTAATRIHTEIKKMENDDCEIIGESVGTAPLKKIPVGCNPEMIEKQLSKSAQRRLRRKTNKKSNEDGEEIIVEEFDDIVIDETRKDEILIPDTKVHVHTSSLSSPPISLRVNDDPSTHYVSKRGFSIRL